MTSKKIVIAVCTPCTVVSRSSLMSLIITFMFEPAKLQMNCASASGARKRRREMAERALADCPVAMGRRLQPRARARALTGMAAALAGDEIRLDRSTDRATTREALLELPGIGPWTADYVGMRALGDPDVFLPTDLGVRNAAARLGLGDVGGRSESWRPWRSYALMRLWSVVLDEMPLPTYSTTQKRDERR